MVEIVKKYMNLRPKPINHNHFFVSYQKGSCTIQRAGIHKIASVPKLMARFLRLPQFEQYTGHCLRRTSSTTFPKAGGSSTDVGRSGSRKSSTVAESHIEDSVQHKIKVAKRLMDGETASSSSSSTAAEYEDNAETKVIHFRSEQTSEEVTLPGISFSGCTVHFYYGKQE